MFITAPTHTQSQNQPNPVFSVNISGDTQAETIEITGNRIVVKSPKGTILADNMNIKNCGIAHYAQTQTNPNSGGDGFHFTGASTGNPTETLPAFLSVQHDVDGDGDLDLVFVRCGYGDGSDFAKIYTNTTGRTLTAEEYYDPQKARVQDITPEQIIARK
jgi:hypothetical protein